jgi:myosin heavy subunit
MSKPSAMGNMRDSIMRSSTSVVAAKASRPSALLPAKRDAGPEDTVLREARALREQAEELSLSRKGNVEALEQQMADLRQRSKHELMKMEKRNRELAADNESLRRDLDLKSTRAQHENDVARQWEGAWTSESDQRRQVVEKLKDTERKLEEENKMHALEKERRETLEQRLETAVLQALTQRQELEDARDKALAEHMRSLAKAKEAEDELSELRPRAARSDADFKSSSRENEELRARNQELQHALNTAQQTIASLTQQLNDSEKRRESQVADVIRQRDEVMEINAQLCGHRNAKQKIQYLLKVKEEKEELKKDKSRLESIVKNLAGSSSAASNLLHLFTPSKSDDSHNSGAPNDSTMLSLAPTEDTPVTPGPCIVEVSNAETPEITAAASINSEVRSIARAVSSTPALRHSAKLTQPRSPRLQTRNRRQAPTANASQV